jgi:hypothetical protein
LAVALGPHLGKAPVRADGAVRAEAEAELGGFELGGFELGCRSWHREAGEKGGGIGGRNCGVLAAWTNGPVACYSMWKLSVAGVVFGPKSR